MSTALRDPHVLVLGGGIGGLSAAIDLAASGVRVTLIERQPWLGGKLRQVVVDGRGIDAGPTVFTMRQVFEGLFGDAGADFGSYVQTLPVEVLARHGWTDGARLDLFTDPERSSDAIAEAFGPREAEGYRRFVTYTRAIYEEVHDTFVFAEKPSLTNVMKVVGQRGVRAVMRIDFRRSMWRALGDFFADPRLRQLFGRYATYYGSSPFSAPATLNLIAEVEREGVWSVQGGMIELARAFERLARERGVDLRTGTGVAEIVVERGRAVGVRLEDGARIDADAVVCNGDPSAIATGLLGADAKRGGHHVIVPKRSLSAITWSLVGSTHGFPLDHHNVFFSTDYPREFKQLEAQLQVPDEPTVYVCAQDRRPGMIAPEGDPETMLVLINAPATGDVNPLTPPEIQRCEERTFELMERCGLMIRRRGEVVTTPREFEAMFPGTGGALYGPATQGSMAPFSRPAATTKIPGLFLVGGGAHPGSGLPMVTLSGRIAARAVREDLRSRKTSSPGVTPGGTSTWFRRTSASR